jgi:hypothetical protein
MVRFGGPDTGPALLAGYNILTDLLEITGKKEAIIEESTVLGDTVDSYTYLGIDKYVDGALEAFYPGSASALLAFQAANGVLMYGLEGDTIGNPCYLIEGLRASIGRQASRDALTRITADFKSASGIHEGVIIANLAARAEAAETTTVDNAASTANGSRSYLNITALTLGGYTNVVIKMRDSTDDITFADHANFTARTAIGSEMVLVTGTVNRYLQTQVVFGGAGSSESVTYAVGTVRVTDQA